MNPATIACRRYDQILNLVFSPHQPNDIEMMSGLLSLGDKMIWWGSGGDVAAPRVFWMMFREC